MVAAIDSNGESDFGRRIEGNLTSRHSKTEASFLLVEANSRLLDRSVCAILVGGHAFSLPRPQLESGRMLMMSEGVGSTVVYASIDAWIC